MVKSLASALIIVMLVGRAAAADTEREQWRPIFYTSLALTIASGTLWGLSFVTMQSEAGEIDAVKAGGGPITEDDCDQRSAISDDVGGRFDDACAWRSRVRTGTMLTIGFGVVAVASAYFAFRGPGDVTVAPAVSADGAGATVLLHW